MQGKNWSTLSGGSDAWKLPHESAASLRFFCLAILEK